MIIATIILDRQFFRRFLLQRVIFYAVAMLIMLFVIFGIAKFFYSEDLTWEAFWGFIFLGLILSILGGVANYFHLSFARQRIKRLREKYSQLPESLQKQRLLETLDRIEGEYSRENGISRLN